MQPPTDWASVKLNLRAASKREEVTPDEIVLVIRLACKHQGCMREDGRVIVLLNVAADAAYGDLFNGSDKEMALYQAKGWDHLHGTLLLSICEM